jgi:hypothetical protein
MQVLPTPAKKNVGNEREIACRFKGSYGQATPLATYSEERKYSFLAQTSRAIYDSVYWGLPGDCDADGLSCLCCS